MARDALVFPEVVTVARALLEPAMAQLVWRDSAGARARPLPADGAFCRELGVRVHRPWLGPLVAVDHGGPLLSWMGAVIRHRRSVGSRVAADAEDPWWVRAEHQPPTTGRNICGLIYKRPGTPVGSTGRSCSRECRTGRADPPAQAPFGAHSKEAEAGAPTSARAWSPYRPCPSPVWLPRLFSSSIAFLTSRT